MKNSDAQKVSEIMSKDLFLLNVDDTLEKAERMFNSEHIRHLPVVADHKLVGMLSWTDLKRLEFGDTYASNDYNVDEEVLHLLSIEQVMKGNPKVLQHDQSITEAANELITEEFHALPVVHNDDLVGIITTTDIIRYLLKNQAD